MRRLRTAKDGTMAIVESLVGESEHVYVLAQEGAVFISQLLRLGDNDEVRASDLRLMIDRGWATLEEAAPATAPAPAPKPPTAAKPAEPAEASEQRGLLTRRTRGREVALQVLYLVEQNSTVNDQQVELFLQRRLREPKLVAFTRGIVLGVREHMKHLDTLISDVAENWRIDRMAAIDRNILRVGAYEMLYCDDVPNKVAINEALELAKRYSTAQSSRFVNGILDRLQTAQPEGSAEATEPQAEAAEPIIEPTDVSSGEDGV